MLSEGHGVLHYNSIDFTYKSKMQTEFIEWTEKNIDDKIARYLQHCQMSKKVNPSNVLSVHVVVGCNHGSTAFQFEASVSVKLRDEYIIEFKVSACEFRCRKDTAKLIEAQYCQGLPSDSWSWQHTPSTYTKMSMATFYASSAKHVKPLNTPSRQIQT